MSDRLTRKDIKRDIREDEVALFINSVFEWIGEHKKLLAGTAVGGVLAVVALMIGSAVLGNMRASAADKLALAVDTLTTPVVAPSAETPNTAANGTGDSFVSEEARREKAKEQLDAVRGSFGGGAAKDVAGLFLADLAAKNGDIEQAQQLWREFADQHQGHMLAIAARLNLISLAREQGEGEALVEELRDELERGRASLPEDILLYELARTLDELGRDEEARTYYQRIVDEHTSSPYAADARTRASADEAAA